LRDFFAEAAKIEDLSPLKAIETLEKLRVPCNPISDVTALAGLTNLTEIWMWRCNAADLSPLAGLSVSLSITRSGGGNTGILLRIMLTLPSRFYTIGLNQERGSAWQSASRVLLLSVWPAKRLPWLEKG